ncbi:hypothetical protein C8R48DRAFT_689457 [Suillus tomentosus]|nr:hypothetical protein C8R48DRAFT_689457 [Suillus tomentosus]
MNDHPARYVHPVFHRQHATVHVQRMALFTPRAPAPRRTSVSGLATTGQKAQRSSETTQACPFTLCTTNKASTDNCFR